MYAANELLWTKMGNFIVIFYYYFPITFPEHSWPLSVTREPNCVFVAFLLSRQGSLTVVETIRLHTCAYIVSRMLETHLLLALLVVWIDPSPGPWPNVSLRNEVCESFPCYILKEAYIFLSLIEQIMGNTIILPHFPCFSCCKDTTVWATSHDWHVSHAP